MSRIVRKSVTLGYSYLQLEGGLFVPDHLEKAISGELEAQKAEDYETLPGLKLAEEISRFFQVAQAQWGLFEARRKRDDHNPMQATQEFVRDLLSHAFGYGPLDAVGTVQVDERGFPIGYMARGRVPVVIAPHTQELDEPDTRFAVTGTGTKRKSPFQLAQEFLNASEPCLWALVTNGRQLRLLRDSAALTRPVWLEVELEQILTARDWAAFTAAWRLFHGSRAGKADASAEDCVWERWRKQGLETGLRVRDSLRAGVQEALLALGSGFLQHPANESLRLALEDGNLRPDAYFQELLRLIYRFLFLFAVEERDLLHPAGSKDESCQLYLEGYSQKRLRERCLRPGASATHHDLWEGQRIVWAALEQGQSALALPALGGLFDRTQSPHLDNSCLSNAAFMTALRSLRWSGKTGAFASVDYRNMGPEELGSVYESLLELVPRIDLEISSFGFVGIGEDEGSTKGNARKTSGSYYTPDSLVQELLKTSLDPVIADRMAQNPHDPVGALLSLRVIDTSCGSGHFLLAAARRIAERLAQFRSLDGAVRPADYRHALRDVISHCIFGVDRNPMAVELARTALWLESFEAERPLSFLDHHLVCGDALLGLMDLKSLELPIPDKAFAALSGDDKAVCKLLAKQNKDAVKSLEKQKASTIFGMDFGEDDPLAALRALDDLSDDTLDEVARKEAAFKAAKTNAHDSQIAQLADAWVGAFLLPKLEGCEESIPTTRTLIDARSLGGGQRTTRQALEAAQRACDKARVLHWPLAFPGVIAKGGFDVVLGNPPWERIKLQEEEFFATRHALVASAKSKVERGKRIEWLSEGTLLSNLSPGTLIPEGVAESERTLFAEFLDARRTAEAASIYFHIDGKEGGRFPLTGVGDVNTYALFSETIRQVLASTGRAGFIVPTGIATDDSTKRFFGELIVGGSLASLFSFENEAFIFPAVHHSYKFCLMTLVGSGDCFVADLVFFARKVSDLSDVNRHFSLDRSEFCLANPNTLTCPTFRSQIDSVLTLKIYKRVPVLHRNLDADINIWQNKIRRIYDMNKSDVLASCITNSADGYLRMYEGKMVHQFDHRWAEYSSNGVEELMLESKNEPKHLVRPRYWINNDSVLRQVDRICSDDDFRHLLNRKWLFVWRDVSSSNLERTVISSIIPLSGTDFTLRVCFLNHSPMECAILVGCMNSIPLDYVARQKIGGNHLSDYIVNQLPILPPTACTQADLDFIVPRVLELTYTAWDLKGWAEDLGYMGAPFGFDPDRRAVLRAELDARYARLYGLTRDELRYILDPSDVMGPEYPTETFRVLKNRENNEYGEYRTQRLVLDAWDREDLNG